MPGMTPTEICLALDILLETTKEFIIAKGCCFPILYLFSRDRKLGVESENGSVITIVTNENGDGDEFEQGELHQTGLAFRMGSKQHDIAIQREADSLVARYNPDGVALVMSCIFRTHRQYRETPQEKRRNCVNGTRCIHICAFLREWDREILRVIPYEKGKKFRNTREHVLSTETVPSEFLHDVIFLDMPWLPDGLDLKTRIRNPYRAVRGGIR